MTYDVLIVGAGVVGALTARELSRYDLNVALLERTNDVAMGASKANSGIVHGGFDPVPGTKMAELNVKGTAMMAKLCDELDVPYKNNGSFVLAFSEPEMETVKVLYDRGIANKVPGLSILSGDEVRAMEPNVSKEVVGALYCSSSGIVCPHELTTSAAANAVANGVDFFRNAEVRCIRYVDGTFFVDTPVSVFKAKIVINAAGVFSDKVAAMIGDDSITVRPRKGEYYLLDRAVGDVVSATIFQCPTKMGKGVLVSPTVDGNLLIGPTAEDNDDKLDVSTSTAGLKAVRTLAPKSVPCVSVRDSITSFTGVRAHATTSSDFIIGSSAVNKYFVNVAGIESPGLSSSPAIAEYVADIVKDLLGGVKPNECFDPVRAKIFRFRHATDEERQAAFEKDPAYGRIICRCESVTEGEIIDAIRAPAGARDVDGVKRRTRAGMGRCQGGFCGSKVLEILSRELGIPLNEVTKFGGESRILYNETK